MIIFSGTATTGAPSESDILVTSNAEIERSETNLVTFNGGFASGVTGAHGRVFNNTIFTITYNYSSREVVSSGGRFYIRVDTSSQFMGFCRDSSIRHIRIDRNASGFWEVVHGNGTVLATGTTVLTTLTWFYITFFARIHDTLGEFEAKLFDADGVLLETLSGSGLDTRNGGTDLAIQTTWGNGSLDTYFDHVWVDGTGAFRGCGFVETRVPVSNGDTVSWTRAGTDSGANWSQVDELPKDEVSRVVSSAADQVELYNIQDRAQAGTVIAVHQIVFDYAATAGTREWKPIAKIGSTVYEGATESTTDTSTTAPPVLINWQNNPSTGNAWADDAEVDAAQIGMKSVTSDVAVQAVALQILVDIES